MMTGADLIELVRGSAGLVLMYEGGAADEVEAIKFGAALLLDIPIIAVVIGDATLPARLASVCVGVIPAESRDHANSAEIQALVLAEIEKQGGAPQLAKASDMEPLSGSRVGCA